MQWIQNFKIRNNGFLDLIIIVFELVIYNLLQNSIFNNFPSVWLFSVSSDVIEIDF